MKARHLARLSRQVCSLAVVAWAFVLLVAMAVACGGGEEETPTATGTSAASGSPTGTVVGAATPAGTTASSEEAPGISDTEILLGAESILSGGLGAVYATIPQAAEAYFKYINDTEGGVCGRKIVYQLEDNFDDPARAVEAARKLVEGDKVFALVSNGGDAPHAASWEYLNQMGVPDMVVAGGHRFGADPQGHPWTVQMVPSYLVEGTFFGQYISPASTGWPA
jgi:branched-chain amino acid transport system substrate-binding protein